MPPGKPNNPDTAFTSAAVNVFGVLKRKNKEPHVLVVKQVCLAARTHAAVG